MRAAKKFLKQLIIFLLKMPKKINAFEYQGGSSVKRPGIHSKTKTSKHKTSKHYKKAYRGQGR
jgi:hypothetical protein